MYLSVRDFCYSLTMALAGWLSLGSPNYAGHLQLWYLQEKMKCEGRILLFTVGAAVTKVIVPRRLQELARKAGAIIRHRWPLSGRYVTRPLLSLLFACSDIAFLVSPTAHRTRAASSIFPSSMLPPRWCETASGISFTISSGRRNISSEWLPFMRFFFALRSKRFFFFPLLI